MLDISRDKVPTMETLCALVDRLASLKVNQVQLYTEHTFAYRHHGDVNAGASPLDADDIRSLDAFCRASPRRARAEPELPRSHEPMAGPPALPATGDRARRVRGPLRHLAPGYDDWSRPTPARSHWSVSCWPSSFLCSPADASTWGSTRPGNCRTRAWPTSWTGCAPCAGCPSSTAARCSCGATCSRASATSWVRCPRR